MPDSTIQRILDQADLANVPTSLAGPASQTAWKALAADLQAGGWRQPHKQAAAVTAAGADHESPVVVDVTVIWSARDTTGQVVDRQRSIVRLLRTDQTWAVDRIT